MSQEKRIKDSSDIQKGAQDGAREDHGSAEGARD